MSTEPAGNPNVANHELSPKDKATRSGSFGAAAADYERFRPGPPQSAVDWLLPERLDRVVDLGAGTGALTRLLVGRVGEVIAVEPDVRMRAVLEAEVPGATAVTGRGEAMPIDAGSVDAVLASSSWHWMDVVPALHEVARVLVPGGFLGALWSGPDPDEPLLGHMRQMMATPTDESAPQVPKGVLPDTNRTHPSLAIPDGVPFDQPDHESFHWSSAMTADDLVGLLGTLSPILVLPQERREAIFARARELLADALGVVDDVTIDVAFRADAYRARLTGA